MLLGNFNKRIGNKIMKKSNNIAVQIAIKKEDKYLLKKIVSEKILKDPDNNYSVAGICKEIISDYLKTYSESQLERLVA
jgi:hypothetical protein